jgi:hypothetical protein
MQRQGLAQKAGCPAFQITPVGYRRSRRPTRLATGLQCRRVPA